MPSIQRPLSGDVLVFDIGEERERAADADVISRSGRNARTLVKMGPLRVTLVVLGPGGELAEHEAPGPITLQVVQGRIRFTVEGEQHDLGPGQLLAAGPQSVTASIPGKGQPFCSPSANSHGMSELRRRLAFWPGGWWSRSSSSPMRCSSG
jgi:quercetin dioxygenase-like cupin family protein